MVKRRQIPLDAVFAALADPTRRAILTQLAARPASVSELARPFDMSLPGVHKHLRVLEHAGLVTITKHGRMRRCALRVRPIRKADRWIAQYRRLWGHPLVRIARQLANAPPPETPWPSKSGPASPPSLVPPSAPRRGAPPTPGRRPRR